MAEYIGDGGQRLYRPDESRRRVDQKDNAEDQPKDLRGGVDRWIARESSAPIFANCESPEDLLAVLDQLKQRGYGLPTADGEHVLDPGRLAEGIRLAFSAGLGVKRERSKAVADHQARVADAKARGKKGRLTMFFPPDLTPDSLDDLLAENGVTSSHGLREAAVAIGMNVLNGEVEDMAAFADGLVDIAA